MNLSAQIAKQLRDVHFGGNWTASDLRTHLSDLSWQESVAKVQDLNTIATLVFHMNYYVELVTKVLRGGPLDGKDIYSFAHPPISAQEDWKKMLDKTWNDAETFAGLIEQLPESRLWEDFADPKYGNYYRNLMGIVEHLHYHLGQIVLIKKLLRQHI